METDYEQIINHFGIENQIEKAIEEMAELTVNLIHWKKNKVKLKEVIKELADVQIMIDQMTTYFSVDKVTEEMDRKLKRTLKRIKIGYYEAKND